MATQIEENAALLQDIFLTPSTEMKADRFSSNQESAASCSGEYTSGMCRTIA